MKAESVVIPAGHKRLGGLLTVPSDPSGVVIFAHGSGSARFGDRTQDAAETLAHAGMATLSLDLLTEGEDHQADYVFGIPLLAERLQWATDWVGSHALGAGLSVGYLASGTAAAAALAAAAAQGSAIHAVVSESGRPDLVADRLVLVRAPTLLIVGGADLDPLELNRAALNVLTCIKRLEIVPRASHLFEESGAFEKATALASVWFRRYLHRVPAQRGTTRVKD